VKIAEAIKTGAETLRNASVVSPERETMLLLRHVLKCDAAFIYSHPEQRLNAVESILFKAVIKRRAAHEPFQYISGVQEFYGLDFAVTPEVLIPRPETEIVVETAINEFKGRKDVRFCEIGAGSGCISVSILVNLPNSIAVASDISPAALEATAKNAEMHHVSDRLRLVLSDVFESLSDEAFDMLVSNPPYVPELDIETLQAEVRSFEPHLALSGGADGLDIIKRIVAESAKYLKEKGLLLMEIGWDQSETVDRLFDRTVWRTVESVPDLQGIPRIIKAQLR
jgi:release factor glutamine methyltransferase